jgi:ABC-type phosphonate transport system ATPase subunit
VTLHAARLARGLPLGRDDPPRLAQVALERVIRNLIEEDADPPGGADEPTGNLDTQSSGEILAFMRHAVDELGQTIVMVTHDATAASHADHAVFLVDGAIVASIDQPTADGVLDEMKRLGG